jgi:hypothetical protein
MTIISNKESEKNHRMINIPRQHYNKQYLLDAKMTKRDGKECRLARRMGSSRRVKNEVCSRIRGRRNFKPVHSEQRPKQSANILPMSKNTLNSVESVWLQL